MNDNLENMTKKEHKKRFLQKARDKIATGVGIVGIAIAAACSTPVTPPPPPPPTEYSHAITIKNPVYMQDGFPAAGNFTVTMSGVDHPGNFDQKLDLPKSRNKIELCKVVLNTTGLTRTYRTGEITDNTQLAPNVVRMPFPIQSYLANISSTGQNVGVAVRDWNITFNPDPLTGLRLDEIFKQGVKVAIYDPLNPANSNTFKNWSLVPNWPINDQYFLRNINYSDGNHIIDPTVPQNGDFWAFRRSDVSGTTHTDYSSNGTSNGLDIVAIKMYINQASADPFMVTNETQVAFMHGAPGTAGHPDLANWSRLMFNRPNTPDYTIGLGGEAQDGFDARSTATPSTNMYMLGSAVNLDKIDEINYTGKDDYEQPDTTFGLIQKPSHILGQPDYYTIPGRNLPLPKQEKKVTDNKSEKY